MMGSPLPLMSALEKLAIGSGGGRTARNWRHYSVAERVRFLSRFGFDQEAIREYHASVKTVKIMCVVAAAILALSLTREVWQSRGMSAVEEAWLVSRLKEEGHRYELWEQLGLKRLEQDKYDGAWEAFEKVVELKPASPKGYAFLATLRANDSWENYDLKASVVLARQAVEKCRDKIVMTGETVANRNLLCRYLKFLAETAFRAENREEAVHAGEEALKLDPVDEKFAARLEVFRKALERSRLPGENRKEGTELEPATR
jgi:tetratricopeptide (TPR) repeat protein